MIRAIFLLALVTGGACANPANQALPVVGEISIENNGGWSERLSSDETPQSCADFVFSELEIKHFFETARAATAREYEHDLDMSRCFASGRLWFSGKQALWKIDRARRGRLLFSDKSERYFYCETCESSKFHDHCDADCMDD